MTSQLHDNLEIFFVSLSAYVEKIKDILTFDVMKEDLELCQYTKLDTLNFWIEGYKSDGSISKPTFRLSNVIDLNDSSEGRVCVDFLNCCSPMPIFGYIFGDSRDRYKPHKVVLNDTYIGSFSTTTDNHAMWKDYGDRSQGCCVFFDKSFFREMKLYRVHYIERRYLDLIGIKDCDDEITEIIRRIAEAFVRQYETLKTEPSLLEKAISIINEIRFLFKTDEWAYENEVRLVVKESDHHTPYTVNMGGVPRSFVNLNRSVEINKILLGAMVNKQENHAQYLMRCGVRNVLLSASTFQ